MGCLPPGHTLNDLLNVSQFATWMNRSELWVKRNLHKFKGVVRHGGGSPMFHPATYLKSHMDGDLDPAVVNIASPK